MKAKIRLIPCWMVALCFLGGCSQGASSTQAAATTDPATIPEAQTAAGTGGDSASRNPRYVITAADMAGILTAPAKNEPSPDPIQCQYATPSAYVSILAQPIGPDNETAWQVTTTYSHVDVPVTGIGDTAFRNADGTTLAARKGGMYCRIGVVGGETVTTDRGEALARKLGALCAKIFVAR